jgi:mono/diheme cytochrome c family protein
MGKRTGVLLVALALAACGEGEQRTPSPTAPAAPPTTSTAPVTTTTTLPPAAPPATTVPTPGTPEAAPPAAPGAAPSGAPPGSPQAGPSDRARAEADQIFATRCTTCHGAGGDGKGPGAAALNPKPRDFGDPSWQSSVTDAHIEKIIRDGGGAVAKSPAMPPNPDLVGKPEVVAALRTKVRAFGAPSAP